MDDLKHIQEPPALAGMIEQTHALGFTMASEPRTGALLRALAASKPGGRMLELGTGTGIGTAWLLAGMDANSTLISIDVDEKVQDVARQVLGNDPRLKLITLDAAAYLWRQPKKCFDLVFADAMPGKYLALDEALAVVRPGGFYIIDDMLPQPSWPEGHGEKVAPLIERLAADERFYVVPMSWASGIVIAVRKPAVPVQVCAGDQAAS